MQISNSIGNQLFSNQKTSKILQIRHMFVVCSLNQLIINRYLISNNEEALIFYLIVACIGLILLINIIVLSCCHSETIETISLL